MDSENADVAAAPPPPPPQEGPNDAAATRELLAFGHLLINQGKPSQALRAVVVAIRTKGGDEAVFQSLHRARELYRNRIWANTAMDQLASLFAERAIAEAQPLKNVPTPAIVGTSSSVVTDVNGKFTLAETGRMQIVVDAFSDGSSFICLQCGGLVSNHRKDEHYAYWCSRL